MRNKRIYIILIVFALLAGLTTTSYAASSYQQSTPSLVGTWDVTIPKMEGNPRETFYAFLTFFADGNMVEANSSNPGLTVPAHGVWIGSGNTYLVTFEAFNFNEQGQHTGKIKAYLSIKMDGADHFNATYTADSIDLAGKVTKKVVFGSAQGTRLEVTLPDMQ